MNRKWVRARLEFGEKVAESVTYIQPTTPHRGHYSRPAQQLRLRASAIALSFSHPVGSFKSDFALAMGAPQTAAQGERVGGVMSRSTCKYETYARGGETQTHVNTTNDSTESMQPLTRVYINLPAGRAMRESSRVRYDRVAASEACLTDSIMQHDRGVGRVQIIPQEGRHAGWRYRQDC